MTEPSTCGTAGDPGIERWPGRLDAARALRLFAGPLLVVWAYSWWLVAGAPGLTVTMSLLSLAAALVIMVVAGGGDRPASFWSRFDTLALAAVLVTAVPWLALEAQARGYPSDEVAIGQAAATALLHGLTPYTADLHPWLHQLGISPRLLTPLLDGRQVEGLDYPALSLLLYLPLGLVLGQGHAFGPVTDVLAWTASVLLLWRLLPPAARPLVPVLASATFYVALVIGGTTDSLFLPFLIAALWRWDRFGDPAERSAARWLGPVMLGLACAVKQTPWLLAPFLVTGIALAARGRGAAWPSTTGRYVAVTAAAFLVPNLPFLVLSPGAWLHAVLLPLTQPLIPFGQGLIQLVATAGLGGGRLGLFGPVALLAEVALLLGFVATHPRGRPALPVLAVVPLALGSRSLPNYFVDVVPPLLVGAASVSADGWRPPSVLRRVSLAGSAGAGALAAVAAVVAIASPPPLSLRVTGAETHGSGDHAETRIRVLVHSAADDRVHPSFITRLGVEWEPGWRIESGPPALAPGETAAYSLLSTDPRVALAPGDAFTVAALLTRPASISVSEEATVATSVMMER